MALPTDTDIQPGTLGPTPAPQKLYSARLGEELPIFCERCGYSLNGLPQARCADCKILQFHCPECGHHQPINTLRPAAQRILGRMRAVWLCFSVFFKLNFFGWLLVAATAIGGEFSYRWDYRGNRTVRQGNMSRTVPQYVIVPREIELEVLAAFGLFGLAFGLFGRMLLLRWRRGYIVGIVLGLLMMMAILLGARLRQFDLSAKVAPWTWSTFMVAVEGASMVVIRAW